MKLVIAEKMSVGQSIARILGANEQDRGYIAGNGYIVTWCIGHLVGLADASVYDEKYHNWQYEDLPIVPSPWRYSLNQGKEQQYKIVNGLINRSDITEIINACDAGREGELIFRFVYNMSGTKKPFCRLWISSMEETAIRDGFANLRDGHEYDNLYLSGLCRAKADWLIGINATRLFTVLYKKRLNIGRVQTPTLAMLVNRDSEISSFRREKYFTVGINDNNISAVSERIDSEDSARDLQTACQNRQVVCVSVKKSQKTIGTPKLYDLTSLQRDANRIFGFTAKQTLDYAQSLYEKKLITYPRTDSRYLTEDMANTAIKIVHIASKFPPFSNCNDVRPDTFYLFNNERVTDHHAIIPTAQIEKIRLTDIPNGERDILHLIMCRLLCAVHGTYAYETVTAEFECNGEKFTAKGKSVISEGWKEIERLFRTYTHTDAECSESDAFDIAEGDIITVTSEINECYTAPPKSYTEDTLLSSMETAGAKETTADAERKDLGTPATRAAIIEKLVQTGLAERKGKSVVATRNGINLVTILPDFLTSPALASEWENNLAKIAKGEYSEAQFMNDITELTTVLVNTYSKVSENDREIFRVPRESIGKCLRCGTDVYESKNNFYCDNKECKFVMWKNDRFFSGKGKLLTKAMAAELLNKGRTKVTGFTSAKTGKSYNTTVILADSGEKYVNYTLEFDKR